MLPPLGAPDAARFDDVERIVVLHARGLGDLVFALPALAALRATYPEATITVLGRDWYGDLLRTRPSPVDEVVAVPPGNVINSVPGASAPDALGRFAGEQAARRYDLAVQLHGGGRDSNPFTLALGARHTVGACSPGAARLERSIPFVHYQHEPLRGLEIVGLAGAAPVQLEPIVALTEADLEEAARVLAPAGAPLVVLHPGAGDPRRRWPPDRFAAVGDALVHAGAEVVVTGSADERDLVAAVVATMTRPAVDLAGQLSLVALAGLLSRCAVVVSNDSGPLHLAAAVGSATVGLYWCGNLINAGPASRRRHCPQLSWQLDCPTCGVDCTRDECAHRPSFLERITVAQVRAEALDLLVREAALTPSARPPATTRGTPRPSAAR
jgi:ADP-heptose:LPS heptosyltransferase